MRKDYYPPGQEQIPQSEEITLRELREADGRTFRRLRIAATLSFLLGAGLGTVGAISFYSSYSHLLQNLESLGPNSQGLTPEYAWCLYAGIGFTMLSMALRLAAWAARPRLRPPHSFR